MTFVQVIHARHDAQGADRLHAPDSQNEFLPDAGPCVTAVEPTRELTILRRVALDVGIEEVEADTAHRHLPDLDEQRAAARVDLHGDRFAVETESRLDRQGILPRL